MIKNIHFYLYLIPPNIKFQFLQNTIRITFLLSVYCIKLTETVLQSFIILLHGWRSALITEKNAGLRSGLRPKAQLCFLVLPTVHTVSHIYVNYSGYTHFIFDPGILQQKEYCLCQNSTWPQIGCGHLIKDNSIQEYAQSANVLMKLLQDPSRPLQDHVKKTESPI